jgi:tRNA modification GTPase
MGASSGAFATDDTIVAIATPPGRGAVGLIRLSGPAAHVIAVRLLRRSVPLAPRVATFARTWQDEAAPGDDVLVTYFPAPHSYTGEDVVEVSAHGSPVVLQSILARACHLGARLARAGEFTLRAHLNGKLDLVQAEAVADLIASTTPLQARLAFDQLRGGLSTVIAGIDERLFDVIAKLEASLDFPDEGYHFVQTAEAASIVRSALADVERLLSEGRNGRIIRDGALVVVSGRPNVGKSLLFNALVGSSRSIVTAIPGTTRDLVTETVDLDGRAVTFVDSAGAREAGDAVEAEGIRRAREARTAADVVLLVLDGHEPLSETDVALLDATRGQPRVIALNKQDLPAAFTSVPDDVPLVRVSAQTGDGVGEVRRAIVALLAGAPEQAGRERPSVSNLRHLKLMEEAVSHLRAAQVALEARVPEEFVLTDLQAARACFDEVVGQRTSADVLRRIFERFCIGK